MLEKDLEGGSPVSTLEVNQVGAQRRGAQRAAGDVDPERPDEPYEEVYPLHHTCTIARTTSSALPIKSLQT